MYLTTRFAVPTIHELQREMDRLFHDFLGAGPLGEGTATFPPLNVWEDAETVTVEAEVPGMKLENLEILIQGNELTIKGRRELTSEDGAVFHRRERGIGEFARLLTLPVAVDAERVEATLKDGVLRVVMPKAQDARTRKIVVKAE